MMEQLLSEQRILLKRLKVITDKVADEAYRQQCSYTVDADLEAVEVGFALANVEQRINELANKQRRPQRQR